MFLQDPGPVEKEQERAREIVKHVGLQIQVKVTDKPRYPTT